MDDVDRKQVWTFGVQSLGRVRKLKHRDSVGGGSDRQAFLCFTRFIIINNHQYGAGFSGRLNERASLSRSLTEAGRSDDIIMSQPGSAPQAASQYSPEMIRPERIANIPMLSAELKVSYTEGLTKLWTALEASPHGSETHNKATAKIKEVSRKIMRHITNWKANNQQQQQRSQAQVPQQQLPNQQTKITD